jgi:hypothetical protein
MWLDHREKIVEIDEVDVPAVNAVAGELAREDQFQRVALQRCDLQFRLACLDIGFEIGERFEAQLVTGDHFHHAPAASGRDDADRHAAVGREERQGERIDAEVDLAAGERGIVIARIREKNGVDVQSVLRKAAAFLGDEQRRHVERDQVTDLHFRQRLLGTGFTGSGDQQHN